MRPLLGYFLRTQSHLWPSDLMSFHCLSDFVLTGEDEISHKPHLIKACSSIRLGRRPLKAERRVQFSYALPR